MPNQYDDILPPLSSEDKMMAGSCYPFWPVVPAFILMSSKRQDPFLAFHAVQALAVGVTSAVLSVVGLFLMWVSFSSLPTSWMMTSGAIGVVLMLTFLAFGGFCFMAQIFLGWQASSGRFLRVAGLGDLCEARMASILGLSATQLRQLAVDRELVPDEKITVLAPVATPEQMQADMDRWAQPAAQAQSWWSGTQQQAQAQSRAPQAAPVQPQVPTANSELDWSEPTPQRPAPQNDVKPWRPAQNAPAAQPQPQARPAAAPEVKPWRPAPAQQTPAARPVSFPSVSREAPEEKKKWWAPKE